MDISPPKKASVQVENVVKTSPTGQTSLDRHPEEWRGTGPSSQKASEARNLNPKANIGGSHLSREPDLSAEKTSRSMDGSRGVGVDQDAQRAESITAARMMIRDMDPQCSRLLSRIEHLKTGQLYKNDPSIEPTSGVLLGGALAQNGLRRGSVDFKAVSEGRAPSPGGREQ